LELDIPTKIYLDTSKKLAIEVTTFDANHCPGAIMILFKGYMGTILHTGDFRFDKRMLYENSLLYPPHLRCFAKVEQCSIHIDELIFDNTFCDPAF